MDVEKLIVIRTYGCTRGAAHAVLENGGFVALEHCPGRPAFFKSEQPTLTLPAGSSKVSGPTDELRGTSYRYTLPDGTGIVADPQHRFFRLITENGGASGWGVPFTKP